MGMASKANGPRGLVDCPNGATRHDDSAQAWGCRSQLARAGPLLRGANTVDPYRISSVRNGTGLGKRQQAEADASHGTGNA